MRSSLWTDLLVICLSRKARPDALKKKHMDKVFNKFNLCEHPRVIQNKYTGDYVYVECGTCPHCLVKRSDVKKNLCDYEKFNKRYCYFVTLTYNSQYVPKMSLTPIEDYLPEPLPIHYTTYRYALAARMFMDDRVKKDVPDFLNAKINKKYLDEYLRLFEYEKMRQDKIRYPVYIGDRRPYILRTIPRESNLQKFKDEYREELVWMKPDLVEKLKRKNQTEGLTGAFPQFKGLLKYVNYRDYQLFAKRLRKYLFKKIGKYEKISSYVVSEYTPKTFRPHFHILFFSDSEAFAQNIRQAVFQSWRLGRVRTELARLSASSYLSNYVNSVVSLPSIYKDVSFTKNKSRFSKLFGFDSYRKEVTSTFEGVDRALERVRFISGSHSCELSSTRSYVNHLFPRFVPHGSRFIADSTTVLSSIRGVLQLFRRNEPFEKESPTNISKFIHYYVIYLYEHGYRYDTLPECVRVYLAYTRTIKDISFWNDSLQGKLSRPLYIYKKFMKMPYSDSYKLRVCDEYYSRSSYLALSRQLEIQAEMFEKMEFSEELLNLYYVKPNQNILKHPNIDAWNERNYKEIHYYRVKHKQLNDANNIFLE